MSYLYQLALVYDSKIPDIYSGIECYKISSMDIIKKNNSDLYECKYTKKGQRCKKTISVTEGEPYGRTYAFYLSARDDEKALDIIKACLEQKNKARFDKLKYSAKRYLWEYEFLSNISTDMEMLVDFGKEPKHKNELFTVIARIYSELEDDYIFKEVFGQFNNYDDAFECWENTDVPNDILKQIMERRRKRGDRSHHELEIKIVSPHNVNLAMANATLDRTNERPLMLGRYR